MVISPLALTLAGTQVTVHHQERLPAAGAMIVVSNHRSLLDVPLLLTSLNQPVRFACHHFMGQLPGVNQLVTALGCFPLDPPGQRPQLFFQRAISLLKAGQPVGIFPEGALPMVEPLPPDQVGHFYRGFAHLALQAPVEPLAIIPVTIAATKEIQTAVAPFKLFHWLAPSEPLFNRSGWHPAIYYRQVHLVIGQPLWITQQHRQHYGGKQAGTVVKQLTQTCHRTIFQHLQQHVANCNPQA